MPDIPNIRYPDHLNDPADGLNYFMHAVSREVASIKLAPRKNDPASVRLEPGSRVKLEQQIQVLKTLILNGDLPGERREALLDRLEDLRMELSQPKVSYAKVMGVLAIVAYGLVEGTQFLADAPHAIATIHSILGHDKETEEAAIKRLAPPEQPKALPKPRTPERQSFGRGGSRMSEIIDDGIPF